MKKYPSCCSDEDMQSVASLMSMGRADIGNLDDIEDEESDVNLSAKFSEITNRLSELETSHQNLGNPFDDQNDVQNIGIVLFVLFGSEPFPSYKLKLITNHYFG